MTAALVQKTFRIGDLVKHEECRNLGIGMIIDEPEFSSNSLIQGYAVWWFGTQQFGSYCYIVPCTEK